ncbi:MAG: anti-sigma factor [Rhizobiales bacterium]|nr:anti-sigma factor [Hyphomicrobiales bacterium]
MTKLDIHESWRLHAYADNELDKEERVKMETQLTDDPEARAEVEFWSAQKRAMKDAYDGVLAEPVPGKLQAALKQVSKPAQDSSWRASAIAAALATLVIGGVAGWYAGSQQGGAPQFTIADRALNAHVVYAVEKRHAVEVAADEKEHLQSWLGKRIGSAFKTPDLAVAGFNLLGGRLLAAEDRPAAQLMYEDANKKRITIFMTSNPSHAERAIELASRGKLVACYWFNDKIGLAVAGEITREEAEKIAKLAYDQMEGEES